MKEHVRVEIAVAAAADRGEPLRIRDVLKFNAADVHRAFDSGLIVKASLRFGNADVTVVLPAPPPEVDDESLTDEEMQYLEMAYCGGVSFMAMTRALKRSGTDVLRQAWRMKWARTRPGAAPRPKSGRGRPRGRGWRKAADGWETEIPAWRIARLRALLEESQARGARPQDDGGDLVHRALRRRFAAGRSRADGPGRQYQPWSAADLQALTSLRAEGRTLFVIARELGRTRLAISSKIEQLGLAVDMTWTEDEDRIVVAGVGRQLTNRQIATMLPKRSAMAVKIRAQRLCGWRGADPWTEEERYALRVAYERGENIIEFAAAIGRTKGGARWVAGTMGLSHPKAIEPYSATEDLRIREGWKRGDRPRDIALDLGRPLRGVYCRAFKIGVTGAKGGFAQGMRPVRRFEIEYIRARVKQGWTGKKIASRINRSFHMVYRIAMRNGIRWDRRGPPRRVAA